MMLLHLALVMAVASTTLAFDRPWSIASRSRPHGPIACGVVPVASLRFASASPAQRRNPQLSCVVHRVVIGVFWPVACGVVLRGTSGRRLHPPCSVYLKPCWIASWPSAS
jgi:hypothetical protein